jgi:hypothetical protein
LHWFYLGFDLIIYLGCHDMEILQHQGIFLCLVDVQFCKIKQNLANLKQLNIKEPKLKLKQIW